MYKTENGLDVPKIVKHSLIGLVVLILLFSTLGLVSAGEVGVRTRFGKVIGIVNQGLYIKLPFIESVEIIDIKTRTVDFDSDNRLGGASKDLQDVTIGVMVNYRVDSTKAENVYNQFKTNRVLEDNVIEPVIRETVKSVSAQYTAEELVTKRIEFSDKVTTLLAERLVSKDCVLDRFSITDFAFSKSFSDAIEAKVTAVQTAEAAKNKLEQVKYEAQQQIEKAKAEAESIRIQAQAINSQGGADYVQLQAISKWDGKLPTQFLPNASVPFINVK